MTLQTMADELAAHRFFRLIPADLRVRLAGCAKNVVFAPGERIRLRLVNAANARIFGLDFGSLAPRIIALDGQPVQSREFEVAAQDAGATTGTG